LNTKKNHLKLNTDECELCGGDLKGLYDCVSQFEQIIHFLNHEDGIKHMTIFMCVDAHTLSHAEIHGRWNNHFHLTRLHLILTKEVKWTYKHSSLLSQIVDTYKAKNKDEVIFTPNKKERGLLSLADLPDDLDEKTYINFINQWALEVYTAFHDGHDIADKIADIFLKKHSYVSQ